MMAFSEAGIKQKENRKSPWTFRSITIASEHVSTIARTCYLELHHLASIRRFLTCTANAKLVSAFVLSRIDYCNSLLLVLLMM